jgi:hypothetical protein
VKTAPLAIIVLVLGIAAGGGAAYGTSKFLGVGTSSASPAPKKIEPPTFLPTGKILAPLVFADGRLAGYASFEVQLEVPEDKAEFVNARLPLLLHAINMRTYHSPLASGPDGMLPDLAVFRALVAASSVEAFGAGIVKRVAITQAMPA